MPAKYHSLTLSLSANSSRYLLGTTTNLSNISNISNCGLDGLEEQQQATTSSVVRAAGYPLEEHAVTTSDGYRLTMQRLPRRSATKIVFFMHGVLDTSLGWVCNGPIGSHAFTAHDSGADVWLGNCRANEGVGDKRKRGFLGYWCVLYECCLWVRVSERSELTPLSDGLFANPLTHALMHSCTHARIGLLPQGLQY